MINDDAAGTGSMELYNFHRRQIATSIAIPVDRPEETPDSILRSLWFMAAGEAKSAELSMIQGLPALDAEGRTRLASLLQRRSAGEPLAYISGRQSFLGLEMLAGTAALVPRKETEILARAAVRLAEELASPPRALHIIDVCTGSANIACVLAHRFAQARVHAADLSESAIHLARENVALLGLQDRVDCQVGDLLAPFENDEHFGQVDLLTCNPPYISSSKVGQMPLEISDHEPRLAFDGGSFGVSIILRLIESAPCFLRTGGWLAFEVGAGQGLSLRKRLCARQAFSEVRAVADEEGVERVILARK